MPTLSKVALASESQVAVGKLLGLNLQGCSVGVAYAQIEDFLATRFWGQTELGHPSVKQCALAKKFGFSIEDRTRGVGAAVIDDVMFQLNMEAIESHGLAPGVSVRHKTSPLPGTLVISSIKEDGTVYFKGGQGKKAWSRNLERA